MNYDEACSKQHNLRARRQSVSINVCLPISRATQTTLFFL